MSAGRAAGQRGNMKDDDNDYGKPIVHVEGIEKGREDDTSNTGHVGHKEKEPVGYFHEGENIKTTYTVEEDAPSLYQRMKGKYLAAEYQVRSMVADYTKKENPHHPLKNPHPSVSRVQVTQKPPAVAQIKEPLYGDKNDHNTSKGEVKGKSSKQEEVKGKEDAEDETVSSERLERFSSAKETFDSGTTEDRKVQAGEELGTGYESGSEEDGALPESNTRGGNGSVPAQSESLFKPVKPKDKSDMTLEELRASKLNQNTCAEDVKAPGIFTRVKEEIDALSDTVSENVGLKGK